MPRILFSHGFPGGGVARVTLDIARYCRQYAPEFEIYVAARSFDEGIDTPQIRSLIKGCIKTRDLEKTALKVGADIVVPCSFMDKGALRARKKGVKLLFANHGEAFHEQYTIIDHRMGGRKRHWWRYWLWKAFLHSRYQEGGKALRMARERVARNYADSDAYVVLCEGYREQTAQVTGPDSSRLHVIHNAEHPVEQPSLEKEKIILYSGRLSEYDKAVDRLLRIWQKAQVELTDYQLLIVGDGPERAKLEALAQELGLERYRFDGWQTDPSPWYRKADIVCLVSRTEGWGLSLSEGMAHGCIPIAFNCSAGVAELLHASGFAVAPGDEDAFAHTLVQVARMDNASKQALRQKGIRYVDEELSPRKIGAQWVSLFRQLLG